MSLPNSEVGSLPSLRQRCREVALLFLKLGATGFGGPAVTIAMMEDEVVTRRGWLTHDELLDLIGATNLIPGPNAAEMAIHIGYRRAGWPGLILGGLGFIVPAAVISGLFGFLYVRYGSLPKVLPFLYGIKPAVVSLILTALWRLGSKAIKNYHLAAIALGVLLANLLGFNEVLALFAGGVLGMAWLRKGRPWFDGKAGRTLSAVAPGPLLLRLGAGAVAAAGMTPLTLGRMFLFFLRVGAVMYGTGYVLIAFLEGGLVQQYGWLTQQQLLDAIAVGQFTPGPLLSTATFIGYLLQGPWGAVLATLAVFAPSFAFVVLSRNIIPRLRRSPWTASFLDAINVSALGLMAAVTLHLGLIVLTDWRSIVIALIAGAVALRWRPNSAWLVLGGALMGWGLSLLG